jgi:mono/diheme cytochrome c family protein
MKRIVLILPFVLPLLGCSPGPGTVEQPEDSQQVLASGLQVYTGNCAACHQVDGSGVQSFNPALVDDAIVAGDPKQLVNLVLKGPATVLPPGRPHYSSNMPPFARLTDQQIADVLTYIRHEYGHQASAIDAQLVQTLRSQLQ